MTRDQLIDACWSGRIVGEDAISRCIARLRKLSATTGAFRIENIPRVGYRLQRCPPTAGTLPDGLPRRALLAAGPLLLLGAAGAVIWARGAPRDSDGIALSAFVPEGSEPETRAMASRLTNSVSGVLSESLPGVGVSAAEQGRGSRELLVDGVVTKEGGEWRVRANVRHVRSRVVVWSQEFVGASTQEGALSDQAAVATAQAIYTANEALQDRPSLDPRALALFITARERTQNSTGVNRADNVRTLEALVAREPRFVPGRAQLAISLLRAGDAAPAEEQAALYARSRGEAERAIRLNPRTAGAAYDTLSLLARHAPDGGLAEAEAIVLEGISKTDFAYLYMRQCQLLAESGRNRDAVFSGERALAARPLAPQIGHVYARALYNAGDVAGARRSIRRFARYHPRSVPTTGFLLDLELFSGDAREAQTLLHDGALRPEWLNEQGVEAWSAFLAARISRRPDDAALAVTALRAAHEIGALPSSSHIFGAAVLGRTEAAFAALAKERPHYGLAYLFGPPGEQLRRDPRFWPAVARLGYLGYWRRRDRWPDFCSGAGVNCRAAAPA